MSTFPKVWQWKSWTSLEEHVMLELQLVQVGGPVLASQRFATSLFTEEWKAVELCVAGSAQVKCLVKLRGESFMDRPSAPLSADVAASELFKVPQLHCN